MIALAGYKGFVGSNIYVRARNRIEGVYDIHNIEKAYGLEPDVLVFAALSSDRRLAARAPYEEYERVMEAQRNIRKINPVKLVIMSTTGVYQNPSGVDEENSIFAAGSDNVGIDPYNLNRYYFEEWAKRTYPELLIMRLARPYGLNDKGNFIKGLADENVMKHMNPKSKYQFYPLSRVWEDIQTAIAENIKVVNMMSEPVTAEEIYSSLTGKSLEQQGGKEALSEDNAEKQALITQNVMSIHADKFGGKGNYICTKSEILAGLRQTLK